jgi:hypothetical protein
LGIFDPGQSFGFAKTLFVGLLTTIKFEFITDKYVIDKYVIDKYVINKYMIKFMGWRSFISNLGSSAPSDVLHTQLLRLLNISPQFIDTIYRGRTALRACCSWSNRALIPILLSYGANPNITDEDGKTVLDIIVGYHYGADVAYILCVHGAKFSNEVVISTADYLSILVKFGFIGVNDELKSSKMTPIERAMRGNQPAIIYDLLNLGSKSSIYVNGVSVAECSLASACLTFVICPIHMIRNLAHDRPAFNRALDVIYNICL